MSLFKQSLFKTFLSQRLSLKVMPLFCLGLALFDAWTYFHKGNDAAGRAWLFVFVLLFFSLMQQLFITRFFDTFIAYLTSRVETQENTAESQLRVQASTMAAMDQAGLPRAS